MSPNPITTEMLSDSRMLFLALLTAHLLGDFLLQSNADVRFKRRPLRLAKHVGMITGLSYLFVGTWTAWWIPLTIAVSHAIIDRLKLLAEDLGWSGRAPFIFDQAAHVGVILALALNLPEAWVPVVSWVALGPLFAQTCLIVSGGILTIHAGGYMIGMTVQPYLEEVLAEKVRRTTASSGESSDGEGLAKGGMAIGQLERALIYFFVLTGYPGAVGFLVAAKSVFRFGELSKSRKEAEYILIGTLLSFVWALIAAWGTGWLGRYWGLL